MGMTESLVLSHRIFISYKLQKQIKMKMKKDNNSEMIIRRALSETITDDR